ncbi:hypothetical protein BCR37DRAFT_46815 [Protomyces lactucae-debilis]|uniref:Uncharacterized protein n=1 Tax=Protomyces lactucae-debilis TaxID=2754530 RepID=A0A1Y2FC94_PROLT|nr:uncharacterized protein BCR37DRAFT_46815 [Protomyces lactucae-debilis]ORY81540.1 hypothetical protein BCR37DRAFT_46815 [Protomyces lactucae-debilis]
MHRRLSHPRACLPLCVLRILIYCPFALSLVCSSLHLLLLLLLFLFPIAIHNHTHTHTDTVYHHSSIISSAHSSLQTYSSLEAHTHHSPCPKRPITTRGPPYREEAHSLHPLPTCHSIQVNRSSVISTVKYTISQAIIASRLLLASSAHRQVQEAQTAGALPADHQSHLE